LSCKCYRKWGSHKISIRRRWSKSGIKSICSRSPLTTMISLSQSTLLSPLDTLYFLIIYQCFDENQYHAIAQGDGGED
jgi:hypothetical protein